MKKPLLLPIVVTLAVFAVVFMVFFTPRVIVWEISQNQKSTSQSFKYFPVTVDPQNKTINEDQAVNTFLADRHSLLSAVVSSKAGNYLYNFFENIAVAINNAPWYQNIASVNGQFVNITPGMRKEQVAAAFGDTLGWNSKQRQAFMTPVGTSSLPLKEGSFYPGLYQVFKGMSPTEIQTMVNDRFSNDVLAHYGTSTEKIVPLKTALTVASLIQRETIGNEGMRLLSGIMWNRLFKGMPLQIDATLQYSKANRPSENNWWPAVTANDKFITSPYNTYLHTGLPPTPISNPSVDAILAALNPLNTPCLYYFNDRQGVFHCSKTYDEHVSLIKQYYGN
ncbi:MAG: endolytic transglycosylase MltG [Patescibacteria group bacterium]|nr:endolytic transglycosylase MltG [Patescibacteria group bacterium]